MVVATDFEWGSDVTELEDMARQALPWPAENANKYSRGKLVLVAGSRRYPGAAVLAARASQRMGAGYSEVITAPEAVDAVRVSSPSLVVRPIEGDLAKLMPSSKSGKPAAVVVGPGFDASDPQSADVVFEVLSAAKCPVVVDGGALAALCQKRTLRFLERRFVDGWETVLTPHDGEAKRLVDAWGIPDSDDEAHRAEVLAEAFGAVVVLKGPVTYLSDGESTLVMDEGTPALAKAGTGDVLAGMVGALLAQGVPALEAAACASLLHARAGTAAAALFTDIGVAAEDVIEAIPAAIRTL